MFKIASEGEVEEGVALANATMESTLEVICYLPEHTVNKDTVKSGTIICSHNR